MKLSSEPGARWTDFDREWNAIKPTQEEIDRAAQRLEQMKSSLPAPEEQQFAMMKPRIAAIDSATHDLWLRIGQSKSDMKPAVLKADSSRLDNAVRALRAGTTAVAHK